MRCFVMRKCRPANGRLWQHICPLVKIAIFTPGTCGMYRSLCGILAVWQCPKSLTSKLIVSASYDRQRRQGAGEFSSPWQCWHTRARLIVHDLMKPLAVPAAGGLLSSHLFFTMLVNTFALQMPAADDIPLGVFTQATVDTLSPFGFTGREDQPNSSIDKDGTSGWRSTNNVKLTREEMNHLGRLVLFTKFNPFATADGQPVSGKILLKSFGINVQC